MMRLFSDLAPEAEVPLKVQSAWRSAIRAEASRRGFKRHARWAGGIAAALVVAAGATLLMGGHGVDRQLEAMDVQIADRGVALIEADGRSAKDMSAAASRAMPMHEFDVIVEDIEKTSAYIADLVSEYEGFMDVQPFDDGNQRCANCYIDLPSENAAEFINAARHFDVSAEGGSALDEDFAKAERVSILLVLKEA